MPVYAWAALGVFVAALAGGLTAAVTHGLRAWRTFRRSRRAVMRELDGVMHGVARAETRLQRLNATSARFARAQAHLQESLAAAAVIAVAAGDARSALRVLAFLRR